MLRYLNTVSYMIIHHHDQNPSYFTFPGKSFDWQCLVSSPLPMCPSLLSRCSCPLRHISSSISDRSSMASIYHIFGLLFGILALLEPISKLLEQAFLPRFCSRFFLVSAIQCDFRPFVSMALVAFFPLHMSIIESFEVPRAMKTIETS